MAQATTAILRASAIPAFLRRVVWPQRELIGTLMRDEHELVCDEVRLFLRDTYDHIVQTAEVIEMYRDMATGLMNTYLSSVANRTTNDRRAVERTTGEFLGNVRGQETGCGRIA